MQYEECLINEIKLSTQGVADRQLDNIPDPSDRVEAMLLTNRYFFSRELYQVRELSPEKSIQRALRNIS